MIPDTSTIAVEANPPALSDIVRAIRTSNADWDRLATLEWLVTNGLGGYASGTLGGFLMRRYHALLVAALPAPLGRMVLVSRLDERVRLPGGDIRWLSRVSNPASGVVTHFELVGGLPVWRYELEDTTIEKRLIMPRLQNTVLVTFTATRAPKPIRLNIRPNLHARPHEAPVDYPLPASPVLVARDGYLEATLDTAVPPIVLVLRDHESSFTLHPEVTKDVPYVLEQQRGYASVGDTWSPGYYKLDLAEGERATFIASTESPGALDGLASDEAVNAEMQRRSRLLLAAAPVSANTLCAELVLAADQFVIEPATRSAEAMRARAEGSEARSVIAGYHWFTDWGRDTMISLEGLTVCTGRLSEARCIIQTFARHLRDGLLPNLFPEGDQEGVYHTVDATLWFFHAIDRYVTASKDLDTLRDLLPALGEVVRYHLAGTRFGIRVDADGLLTQGDPNLPLTWMDAKVGDWVVTPRRGKTVEINALWFNAVRLLADWYRLFDRDAGELDAVAARARDSFNRRFWYAEGQYLYDIVDGEHGDDASLRPNQIFSLSLRYPILEESRWQRVVDVVEERLLTPYGLRTLAQGHADFKAQYFGDLRARDAAYHQGTVWAWLIGPFIDAWMRVHPDRRPDARAFLAAFDKHLTDACVGTISEVFDATEPYAARGCVAQAWSVAEVLRSFIKLQVTDAPGVQAS
jgi:predicted glycogen debranching enzyme